MRRLALLSLLSFLFLHCASFDDGQGREQQSSGETPAEGVIAGTPETDAVSVDAVGEGVASEGDAAMTVDSAPEDGEQDSLSEPDWQAPVVRWSGQLSPEEMLTLQEWSDTRSIRRTAISGVTGRDRSLFYSYIAELLEVSGVRLRRQIHDSAYLLHVTVATEALASELNHYGSTKLELSLRLEGAGDLSVGTMVEGPLTLSRLSARDGQLNSLRTIVPDSVATAISALRQELTDIIVQRGIPYRVYPQDLPLTDDYRQVLENIGRPDERGEVWYIPLNPGETRERLVAILEGSPYSASLEGLTRTIRFIYNGRS